MPTTAKQLRSQLGLSNKNYGYIPKTITNMLPTWHKIGKPSPLFTKIEDQKVEMLRNKYAGQQETNGEPAANKISDDSIVALEAAITKQVSSLVNLFSSSVHCEDSFLVSYVSSRAT
jgi:methionyl-tRNA synthetase